MKLIELLQQSDDWDDEATIYVARPWSCDAKAILVNPAPDTTAPIGQDGTLYDYFLETFIAREVRENYAASDDGRFASLERQCERIVSYAENDA